MTEYVPTTDDVKARYAASRVFDPQVYRIAEEEFDAWLTQHDAEVRAAALRDAAGILDEYAGTILSAESAAMWMRMEADRIEKEVGR